MRPTKEELIEEVEAEENERAICPLSNDFFRRSEMITVQKVQPIALPDTH